MFHATVSEQTPDTPVSQQSLCYKNSAIHHIVQRANLNESSWAVLCCGAVYYTAGSTLLSLWMKYQSVTIQMKATEQYFAVVLFIMLYKVVLTFESVDEILKCDHSNESYWAVLSCGAVQGGQF